MLVSLDHKHCPHRFFNHRRRSIVWQCNSRLAWCGNGGRRWRRQYVVFGRCKQNRIDWRRSDVYFVGVLSDRHTAHGTLPCYSFAIQRQSSTERHTHTRTMTARDGVRVPW